MDVALHTGAAMVSGVLSIACYVPYIRDIIRGTTKPARVTWLVWSVLGSIATFTQVELGATWSLVLVATQTLGITVVFMLSVTKSDEVLTTADLLCVFVACNGIVLWHFTSQPIVALCLVVAIDALAVSRTLVKTFHRPASETTSTWMLAGAAGVFTSISVEHPSFELLLYPVYVVLLNAAVLSAQFAGRRIQQMQGASNVA